MVVKRIKYLFKIMHSPTWLTILVCCNHLMYLSVVPRCQDFNQAPLVCSNTLETEHEVHFKLNAASLYITRV